ncbi:hypothetical protein KPH14_005064 [Odynerus spinipes]|uniref:Pentraxin (PTX) domain-containing protein n=1 Tax=Odynerus spinipes TaxID=1348599 RepID=A0AAD9RLM5_9HYME|nr:hypothetical protein KPH14_005064 [Odynerus spinipes]
MSRRRTSLVYALLALASTNAISSPWRPVSPLATSASTGVLGQEAAFFGSLSSGSLSGNSPYEIDGQLIDLSQEQDQCSLYKISMSQQLYFEYVHYKIDLPDIKEFTLCMWTKFHNHTNDHPLFSYAVGDQPRGILSWVANTARSSYYMMNVDGHNLYRLNYPLRLNKWYHSCQSWNGRTGEWQIWVNDERVGRGFNNRLVGHVIKGGGIAITGQEQRQLGGGFLEGEGAPQGAGGMLGEITMLQLYSVALTAGKAHKDHKHHHVHHYEHDTTNNTPRPTTRAPVTGPPLPASPFLTAGQINPQVKINPGASLQLVRNGMITRHPVLASTPREPPARPFPSVNLETLSTVVPFGSSPSFSGTLHNALVFGNPLSPTDSSYHELFKREKNLSKRGNSEDELSIMKEAVGDSSSSSSSTETTPDEKVKFLPRTNEAEVQDEKSPKKRSTDKKKRALLRLPDGGLILDESYAVPQGLENDYFSGLANFGIRLVDQQQRDNEDEREPAEGEVKRVMDICDGCAEEPFEKALIMGWRSVPKKIYSGALYLPASRICKAF